MKIFHSIMLILKIFIYIFFGDMPIIKLLAQRVKEKYGRNWLTILIKKILPFKGQPIVYENNIIYQDVSKTIWDFYEQ